MNRGTVRPHGTGKWRVQTYLGVDPVTGKERRKSKVIVGTRKDAERALTRMLGEVDGGKVVNGVRTFGQVFDAYISQKQLSLAGSSADTYASQRAYLPERFLATPVHKIDVEMLEALYAHLATKGRKRDGQPMQPKSIRNVHQAIYGALELARRRKWIVANPAVDAEVPAVPKRQPSPADAARIPALFVAAKTQHKWLPAYIRLSLCVGGRRSEIHGLRWSGVDFARSRVVIRDTIVRAGGEWQVKPRTKTGDVRTVHVDAGTLAELRARHADAMDVALDCGTTVRPDGFVFSDAPDSSTPWNPNTTLARFKRACEAAGLAAGTRPHDLRHLMATYLIDQGQPIPVVSARLGHSTNSITLDVYTGRVAASDVEAAEVMGRFLDGAGS